jgi:hypothetical protein
MRQLVKRGKGKMTKIKSWQTGNGWKHELDGRLKSLPGKSIQAQMAYFRTRRWPIFTGGDDNYWIEPEGADSMTPFEALKAVELNPDYACLFLYGYHINGNIYLRMSGKGYHFLNNQNASVCLRNNPEVILWTDPKFKKDEQEWIDTLTNDRCLTGTLRPKRPQEEVEDDEGLVEWGSQMQLRLSPRYRASTKQPVKNTDKQGV